MKKQKQGNLKRKNLKKDKYRNENYEQTNTKRNYLNKYKSKKATTGKGKN